MATKPFSLRITEPQLAALDALREKTGLTVQEQVRRAIDLYLAECASTSTADVAQRILADQEVTADASHHLSHMTAADIAQGRVFRNPITRK